MRKLLNVLFLVAILTIADGFSFNRVDYRNAMYKNVCKDLKGEVLVYFIFVDSKETSPWTEFDIKTTIDSINIATKWLQQMAIINNISLKIKSDYYIGSPVSTIKRNLAYGTVQNTISSKGMKQGMRELNNWADAIAKKAGSSFNISEKDGIPDLPKPKNKERLIAYLRDEYKVESVAFLILLNNYYKTDISIPVNTMSTDDVEFAIVSYKYPSEIAHNILHLYGAADLYKTPYRRNEKKIKLLESLFPNEIMQDPYGKLINNLEISDYTKYLIGWKDQYPPSYSEFYTDKFNNFY
jgi:hypothetical protein